VNRGGKAPKFGLFYSTSKPPTLIIDPRIHAKAFQRSLGTMSSVMGWWTQFSEPNRANTRLEREVPDAS
jgi:hypothetical protein